MRTAGRPSRITGRAAALVLAAVVLTVLPAAGAAGAAVPRAEAGLPGGTLGAAALASGPGGSRQLLVERRTPASKGRPATSRLWSLRQTGASRRWAGAVPVGAPDAHRVSEVRLTSGRAGALVAAWVVETDGGTRLLASVRPSPQVGWRPPTELSADLRSFGGSAAGR